MNKKRVLAIIAIVAIVAIMTACLCACNAESITKKLEKKGYTCVSSESDDKDSSTELKAARALMEKEGYKGGLEWVVGASNGDESVLVYKYEKASDARKDYKEAKEGGKYAEVKLVGSVIFYGTKQGVKDAM